MWVRAGPCVRYFTHQNILKLTNHLQVKLLFVMCPFLNKWPRTGSHFPLPMLLHHFVSITHRDQINVIWCLELRWCSLHKTLLMIRITCQALFTKKLFLKSSDQDVQILLSNVLSVLIALVEEKQAWDAGHWKLEGTLSASQRSSSKPTVEFCFSARSSQALKEAGGCGLVYSGSFARLHDGAELFNRSLILAEY